MASIAFGNADSLLVVAKASVAGSRTARRNWRSGMRTMSDDRAEDEHDENDQREIKREDQIAEIDENAEALVPTVWAMAAPTPMGANIMT